MPVNVPELRTVERSFGFEPDDLVIVGDRFQHTFRVEDPTDCTPADFSGYTPTFELVDSAGVLIAGLAGTVTPSPGDTTGQFEVVLTDAQTTLAGEVEVAYRLRIDDGAGVVLTLFCGQFKLSICKADA